MRYDEENQERRRVVTETQGERQEEVISESREVIPRGVGSGGSGWVIAFAIFTVLALIGVALYFYGGPNATTERRTEQTTETATPRQLPSTTVVQQQPALQQQPPVIVQQPAPVQQAPVIIQQPPIQANANVDSVEKDDTIMQNVANKKLLEDPEMATVKVDVHDARATLGGIARSEEIKARAEQIVKAVRGIKSVENKIKLSTATSPP